MVSQDREPDDGAPPRDRAVISDVAELSGVSKMTVSRVLNGHPRVSAQTRARVLTAISTLGYSPRSAARALATGRSRILGVVSFDTALYGPAATLSGIEQAAREAGYFLSVVTLQLASPWTAKAAMRHLKDQEADGIILSAPHAWAAAAVHYLSGGTPVVVTDSGCEAAPSVVVDQHSGALAATQHLLRLGHETVWHVAGPHDWMSAQVREQGWRDALEEAGNSVPPVMRGDWSVRSGYEMGQRIARQKGVSAIFAANDQMALGVLRALRENGADVPGDVSLTGFDDVPEAAYFWPPLTTVRQDFDEVGRRSLQLLLEQVEGSSRSGRRVVVETELIVRESSAPRSGVEHEKCGQRQETVPF
jgi:DNA-binding LacI/PurR family transcriptional regulator